MAKDPRIGYKVVATITGVKGKCNAGHQKGDRFEISCHNPSGLCGYFYHDIFPNLSTFQFGGNLPWWEGDVIQLQCPDSYNLVSLKLDGQRERSGASIFRTPMMELSHSEQCACSVKAGADETSRGGVTGG